MEALQVDDDPAAFERADAAIGNSPRRHTGQGRRSS
jgi:hypothetical protein